MNVKVIILAWWSWTRLWPLSRKYYPKQFLKLKEFDNNSFFEKAINRAKNITDIKNIFVVTNKDYKFHCMNQSDIDENNIIIEPESRNTMWAILLWIEKWKENDVFLVLSSDHVIKEEDLFSQNIKNNINYAQKNILLFGIKPNKIHTWYWYIEFEKNWNKPFQVTKFKEKPDEIKAKEYIENWYYWNAWIFMFSKKVFLNELENYNKEYYDLIKDWVSKNFIKLPNISIDYWILEKSKNIKIIPLDIYWNDLWWFEAFEEYFNENNIKSKITEIESKNNLVFNENSKKEIALIWIEDIIVVNTDNALLISKKWESRKVKEVIDILKKENKIQSDYWNIIYRPWWSYKIIDEWIWFKIKRISILPWKKISNQIHNKRTEHWVIVSWKAKITIWEKEFLLEKWSSTFISIWEKHKIENIWKIDLHIIESHIWDYLEEDDIVRFDEK